MNKGMTGARAPRPEAGHSYRQSLVATHRLVGEMPPQKHEFGCGAACVACVTHSSYCDVVRDLGLQRARTHGFYCRELVESLHRRGYQYEYRHIKPALRRIVYEPGVIVFVRRSRRYPAGHYVVRTSRGWADPWINMPRNRRISAAEAGVRLRLPGLPQYALFPVS